jgi:hypothetical protein
MDERTRQHLAQLTGITMQTILDLGADTPTTLKLIQRASGFLALLHRLYQQRDRTALADWLSQMEITEDEDAGQVPALPQP